MDNSSGAAGERAAAEYLEGEGCEILAQNYRSRFGEIDLIVRDGRYLVFVEVKTRKPGAKVGPLEAVSPAKRRRIVRTALMYLRGGAVRLQPRFDVVAVSFAKGGAASVRHLKNAFGGEGLF
jgi:putative endonuclease